jgi:hypothetical protein
MDLDLWISKVKEGQHLAEHELQSLCEYVRLPTPWLSRSPLGFCSPGAISIAGVFAGVLGFLVVEVDEGERLALLPVVDGIGAKRVLLVDMFVPVCNRGCFHWLSR